MARFLGSVVISLLLALLIAIGARSQGVQLMFNDSPVVAPAASLGWDTSASAATFTFSGTNNKTATTTAPTATWRIAVSSQANCTNKFYTEITPTVDGNFGTIIGFTNPFVVLTNQWGTFIDQEAGWQGVPANFGMTSATNLSFVSADVISLAIDIATAKAWARKNGGTWAGGGDPATGTTPSGLLTLGTNAGVTILFSGYRAAGVDDVATLNGSTVPAYSIPSGFSAWDSGTPCTMAASTNGFDPAISSANMSFSGTNNIVATAITTTATWRSAKSVTSHSGGKYFVEFRAIADDGSHGFIIGFGNSTASTANYAGSDGNSLGCQINNNGYGGMSACGTWKNGDVVDFEIDTTAKKVWGRINGAAWTGGGNPETGTTPTGTYTFTGAAFAMFSGYTLSPSTSAQIYTGTTPVYAPTASYAMWN